jgi:hypothetical protein
MKEAIKKAIEEGWIFKGMPQVQTAWLLENSEVLWPKIVLDPLFWQALGKAEGWGTTTRQGVTSVGTKTFHEDQLYLDKWHRLIDHLAEGKDADSFFKELLK